MTRQRTRTSPIVHPTAAEVIATVAAHEPILPPIEERQPDFTGIMNQISSRMGANVMQRATAVPGFNQIETGIFALDMALLGGIPEGLTTMFYGWESSGKTTLAKRIAGRMQKKYPDKAVVFVDLEHTYDNAWGAKHGIDNERLIVVRPDSGEQAVDVIDAVLQTPETALVIVDSLPTLIPMKEIEDSAEDALVAVRARLIGRLCSKILSQTGKTRNAHGFCATTVLINQWRTKIGVFKGNPNVLPGGNQPKYLCTTMIELKNREILKNNGRGLEIVSHNDHAFVLKKSRIGNSARNGEFQLIRDPSHELGEGTIDQSAAVVTYGKRFGIITGGGQAWRIDGYDHKFGKLEEITRFFDEYPDECLDMQRRIIMVLRQEGGLLPLPPDSYLLGHCELV